MIFLNISKIRMIIKLFRILKGWDIRVAQSKTYSGVVHFKGEKGAIIYDWGPHNKPDDFEFHEVLHIALKALLKMDKRKIKELRQAEEEVIQDICEVVRIWR